MILFLTCDRHLFENQQNQNPNPPGEQQGRYCGNTKNCPVWFSVTDESLFTRARFTSLRS